MKIDQKEIHSRWYSASVAAAVNVIEATLAK
jgi:hypothetical protein